MIRFSIILSTIIFLSLPIKIFAQTPTLGTTANFVLFTTTGAVGNTGISQVTGDVGSNSGATTGFGNVNGIMQTSNGATAAAASDLFTLYSQLNSAVSTASHAPLLGNGDTLTPGVYAIAGNTTLNLNLVLNAQSDPNAVFIFQISGTLSTNAASEIILLNGAKACNVFWKVEGLVSMAAGSKMKGNVVANNGAINMNSNVELEGRALSTTGALSVSNVLAYTPVGCGSPTLTGPIMPTLGPIACYALFSANGAVTNAPGAITNVTGDIGSNTDPVATYNPLLVNGTIHLIPDTSTASAATDLLNLYTYLNALTTDIELLYPAQFGNKLVLTPHTYLLNAATTFIDTLFLNAEGNTNAIFVMKINGALTTGTYAVVALTNGTKASNVFWKVEGAVNINDYSVFKGTIISNNGAVNLNTGVMLDGRAFTTTGALSTASITADMPPGCNSPLPISLLSFTGNVVHNTVELNWSTASEINNNFFTLEKSADGTSFETLANVKPAHTANLVHNYSYTDPNPYTEGFYRLSQTDFNGKTSYFKTIKITVSNKTSIYHYSEGNYIYVHTVVPYSADGALSLWSMDGRKLLTQKITLNNQNQTWKLEKPAISGLYIIRLESNGRYIYTEKLIVE